LEDADGFLVVLCEDNRDVDKESFAIIRLLSAIRANLAFTYALGPAFVFVFFFASESLLTKTLGTEFVFVFAFVLVFFVTDECLLTLTRSFVGKKS